MTNEQSWTITGGKIGGIWAGWRRWKTEGSPNAVEFSAKRSLNRSRFQGDLLGWYHTHPGMHAVPSERDVVTMQSWCLALGKPLLCVIHGSDGTRGYIFNDDDCRGVEMMKVYELGWGIVIGVEFGRAS